MFAKKGIHKNSFVILHIPRIGMSTSDEYELLSTRIYTTITDAKRFTNSIYLMHSYKEVHRYNLERLSDLATSDERICRIMAYQNSPQAKGISADQMLGLKLELLLARGSRVMLTSNEWTQNGLTNGATGTLRHLIFEENGGLPDLPIVAVVEINEFYKGPHLDKKPRHVVITPKTCSIHNGSTTSERTQITSLTCISDNNPQKPRYDS